MTLYKKYNFLFAKKLPMKEIQKINNEINELTLKIEQEYPELYQYLNENPVTVPCCENPELDTKVFSDWLESLKDLLKDFIENQQNSLN